MVNLPIKFEVNSISTRYIKTAKRIIMQTMPHDRQRTLVFWCQGLWT